MVVSFINKILHLAQVMCACARIASDDIWAGLRIPKHRYLETTEIILAISYMHCPSILLKSGGWDSALVVNDDILP